MPFGAKSCILNAETFPSGKEVQKNVDTSWNHHADRSGHPVCTGRCMDLQAGRLEGRRLRRQLCILSQPLRKPGPRQKALKSISQAGRVKAKSRSGGAPCLWKRCLNLKCPRMLPAGMLRGHSYSSAVCFTVEHAALGRVHRHGAQQVLLGFFIGRAPDVQPVHDIVLCAVLDIAQLKQVGAQRVVLAVIGQALFDRGAPAVFHRIARPLPHPVPIQRQPRFISLLVCHTLPSFFHPHGAPAPRGGSALQKSRGPARTCSGPALR